MKQRFYETVTVAAHNTQPSFEMPCHASVLSLSDPQDPSAPNRVVTTMRLTFPAEFTVKVGQDVTYRGQGWRAGNGDQIHTRRGRVIFKTAELTRVTG